MDECYFIFKHKGWQVYDNQHRKLLHQYTIKSLWIHEDAYIRNSTGHHRQIQPIRESIRQMDIFQNKKKLYTLNKEVW